MLPASAASVADARHLVLDVCRGADGADGGDGDGAAREVDDFVHTAVLLTSEVVTNAVIHGRSEVRLAVRAGPGTVTVEVGDDNSRTPQLQVEDDGALDGRGMTLVDLLADGWGVREDAVGKTVWFTVTAPGG